MLKKWLVSFFIMAVLIPVSFIYAHSLIETRTPISDSILEKSPPKVELFFEEPVEIHRSSIIVRNEKGTAVQLGRPRLDPSNERHMMVDLQKDLPSGQYTVIIDVVSIDGHALKEKYEFQVKIKETSNEEKFKNLILERTFPGDGIIIQQSPQRIELWYSEAAEMDQFGLLNDGDRTVPIETPTIDPHDPKHFTVNLKDKLPNGTYFIVSQVKIGDQKKYDIVYFAVEEFTPITGPAYTFGDTFWNHVELLQWTHWITYSALLALVGGFFVVIMIFKSTGNDNRWRMITNLLYGISVLALLLELLVNKVQYSEVIWKDFAGFYFVRILISQIILLAISYFVLWNRLKLFFLVTVLFGLALTGHTAAPNYGGAWSISLDFIHLLAASIWIDGLLVLATMAPKENPKEWLKEKGRSFSQWALASMIVLPVSGLLVSTRFVPSFSLGSMLSSYWGKMLVVKIILYILVVAIGVWQRRRLAKWAINVAAGFQKLLRVEMLIASLILFTAAVLVDLSPKEAEQGIYPQPQAVKGMQATVKISPFIAGPNEITIRLNDFTDIQRVSVKFSNTTGWSVENNAFSLGQGIYKLTGGYFHAAGTMNMDIHALRSDGTTISIPYKIQVPGVMPPNI